MIKLAWLGLGAMGLPMARRLRAAGHHLVCYDPNGSRRTLLASDSPADSRGHVAETAEAAVADAQVVFVMVATPRQLHDLLLGSHAAVKFMMPGTTVVVMSTVGPDALASCRSDLAAHRIDLVDAPVSGGVTRAEAGELIVMAGADERILGRVAPLLEILGRVFHVGDTVGDGQSVKLVNQLLCAVHIVAAAEALTYAKALGLDPAAVHEVACHGAADSFMLRDRGRRMLTTEPVSVMSALDIFVKDINLVMDKAIAAGFVPPLATVARRLFMAGHDAGLGGTDDSRVIDVLRKEYLTTHASEAAGDLIPDGTRPNRRKQGGE